jgi:hypothetical protein
MPTTSPVTSSEIELARLEAEIRASVGSEDFARTQTLLERYRGLIEGRVRMAAHPQAECRLLAGRTRQLYEWARSMTLISRAKYQARLSVLRDASLYLAARGTEVKQPRLQLKA